MESYSIHTSVSYKDVWEAARHMDHGYYQVISGKVAVDLVNVLDPKYQIPSRYYDC